MGDPVTIRNEDVGRIGEYVKPWLRELVDRMIPKVELSGIGTQLMERMVRVEEELKAQRELMDERFGFMERRFEAVDRRFEDLIGNMNARFEAVDRRFETVDKRFEELTGQMNHRFTTLTWLIGVGFVVITSLTTVFALLAA